MTLGLTQVRDRQSSLASRSDTSLRAATKSPLFHLLAVCVAASGLLASAQAAFAQSVEHQTNREEAQHLLCVKQGEHLLCDVEPNPESDNAAKDAQTSQSLKSSTATVTPQLLTPVQQKFIENTLLGLSYLLPCGLLLGLFLYDKYSDYRLAVLNQQIEHLEKLWKQSTQR